MTTIKESLILLQKNSRISREQFAKAAKVGKQRAYGIIDILEDLGLVDIDKSVRPYQVRLNELGKRFISLLAKHKPSEIMKSIMEE